MSRPRRSFGQQPGRLVATMLRALAAELSDPGRYARAKAYARDDAVIEIDIRPEVVSGLVMGSRRDPYEVLLAVDPVPDDERARANPESIGSMTLLIPGRDELAVSCSCPDAAGTLCKHAIALLLVFADETSIEPELLVRWRSEDPDRDRPRPGVQRMAPRGRVIDADDPTTVTLPPPRQPARAPAARVDILAGLLDASGPLPDLPALAPFTLPAPPVAVLNDPAQRLLHELLTSALAAITTRPR
ncbi:SWIM zinc finger family protein [Desertimonas flava]|uniref:SWIM zinc finger family protein n=1 Tax=Desertimonas flava TaxID=2064846 RepID=UPI000E341004|nr:SWIM zinc finger family protein [Desertimonas flava]